MANSHIPSWAKQIASDLDAKLKRGFYFSKTSDKMDLMSIGKGLESLIPKKGGAEAL